MIILIPTVSSSFTVSLRNWQIWELFFFFLLLDCSWHAITGECWQPNTCANFSIQWNDLIQACKNSSDQQWFQIWFQLFTSRGRVMSSGPSWRDNFQMDWATYFVMVAEKKIKPVKAWFSICTLRVLIMLLAHLSWRISLTIQCNMLCSNDSASTSTFAAEYELSSYQAAQTATAHCNIITMNLCYYLRLRQLMFLNFSS